VAGACAALDVLPDRQHRGGGERIRLATCSRWREADALLLVDVFGATPCNAAVAVADGVARVSWRV
jgi:mannose PTS system EIIA component